MFATVGDKIRQVRQQFHLKQGIFVKFGITQHYLSMIETNKRQAPQKTLIDIYEALMSLTDGQLASLYTLEEFLKTPEEQAIEFIENHLDVEEIAKLYDEMMLIAQTYHLTEYIIRLEELLGEYYFFINDGNKAVQHLKSAIIRARDLDINPYILCLQLGVILRKLGRYVESISSLSLAIGCSKTEEQAQDAKVLLIVTYYRMGKYDLTEEVISQIEAPDSTYHIGHYVGAKIIKEGSLRKQGYLLEARECLLPLASDDKYEPYYKHVYHCLGWNYIEAREYGKALETLKIAYPYRESEIEKALTILLIGGVYFEMGNYEEAQTYYTQVKETILSSCSVNSKKIWFDKQFDLYWHTDQIEKIKQLQLELILLIDEGQMSQDVVDEIKKNMFERISNHISLKEEEYSFLYNFLSFK